MALVQEKISQAAQILGEFDVDLWLTLVRETSLAPDPALDLILGVDVTWHSAFLISRNGSRIAIVGQFETEGIRALNAYDEVIGYHTGFGELLLSTIKRLNPQNIAINYSESDVAADGLTLGNYRLLSGWLEGTEFADMLQSGERVVAALRGRKTRREIALIRQAIATTEALFQEVESTVQPGLTQREIAAFVRSRIEGKGLGYAWDKNHNPIVTCGPHSAIGHVEPGNVPVERGHTLHMDLGIKQDGFCSDLQRMWYVLDDGESSAPPEVQRAFETVRGAIQAAEQALVPGRPGWQVDEVARRYVTEAGYPEYMHATGHLLGRSAHDGSTVLGPRWDRYAGICELPVEVGNVFTLELHVVVPERGIMSLEEDVVVTSTGVEYLSTPQETLRYI